MSYTIKYDPRIDCIVSSIKGIIDFELAGNFTRDAARAIREHNCSRLLGDFRRATTNLSVLEIDDAAQLVLEVSLESGVPPSFRRAIVVARDLEDYSFFQSASRIRHHNIRVFTDIDEAKAWLSSPEAGPEI